MKFDRALLYVGPPKTGSTSIQSFVWKSREALMAQGFYVPIAGRRGSQHVALAALSERNAGGKRRRVAERRANGAEEASGEEDRERRQSLFLTNLEHELDAAPASHTLFFMSESLFASDAVGIRAFREVLSNYAPRLESIMYLRRQDLWLASRTLQQRKSGARRLSLHVGSPQQFSNIVHAWHSESDRCIIRRLDPAFLLNGSLIQDFCAAIDVDTKPLDITEIHKNTALLQEQLELVDQFNKNIDAIPFKKRIRYRSNFLLMCSETLGGTRIQFPLATARDIFTSFAPINAWLHETIDPSGPPLFFNPDFEKYEADPTNGARYTMEQLTRFLASISPEAKPATERGALIEQTVDTYLERRRTQKRRAASSVEA